MNNADRNWLEERFERINQKLDLHSEKLASMEERWSMVCRFTALIGGIVALITSIVIGIIRR